MDDKIKDALYKRAVGFEYREVQEDSVVEDGIESVQKRKVTTKYQPPDNSAIKLLLDLNESEPISQMSDEELEAEKQRLIAALKK